MEQYQTARHWQRTARRFPVPGERASQRRSGSSPLQTSQHSTSSAFIVNRSLIEVAVREPLGPIIYVYEASLRPLQHLKRHTDVGTKEWNQTLLHGANTVCLPHQQSNSFAATLMVRLRATVISGRSSLYTDVLHHFISMCSNRRELRAVAFECYMCHLPEGQLNASTVMCTR